MSVHYELISQCPHTQARRGRLHTAHGVVELPAFMPVGTQATVKTVSQDELESLDYRLVLANTYHLLLRPGPTLIEELGGLHRFMAWKGPILTDSGGFQVMSLASSVRITDQSVIFRSHKDGSEVDLSPERAIFVQRQLGVDISMALDECPPYPCTKDQAAEAMRRTHLWAARCLEAKAADQALFGIVQGGVHDDLRDESLNAICAMPFEGFAIGGVSVGEPTELQYPVVARTAPKMPADRVRYLMGVGHPADILHAVSSGIDLFDCVLPTRMARHHALYTLKGRVNIANEKWARHDGPVDSDSVFPLVGRYSAAYMRHLFKVGEPLGARLASLHNLAFYSRLMAEIRRAIEEGSWPQLLERYAHA